MLSPIQSNIVVPNTGSGRTFESLNLDANKGREGTCGQGDTGTRGSEGRHAVQPLSNKYITTLFFLFVITAGFSGGGVVGGIFLIC